jgi:hypothetical protein
MLPNSSELCELVDQDLVCENGLLPAKEFPDGYHRERGLIRSPDGEPYIVSRLVSRRLHRWNTARRLRSADGPVRDAVASTSNAEEQS